MLHVMAHAIIMGMTRSTKEGLAEWSLSDDIMVDNSAQQGEQV
jgi:hypothetical protein